MSLPRYPKYKDSGVEWLGEVPTHWKVKRLRFVCQLNPSKSEIVDIDKDTLVSFLPMEAIGDDGSLDIERERPISELETGYTFFRNGDVAVAKITPCFENGKGALMQNLRNGFGFGTTELIVARPKPTETSGKYLHWIFVSSPFMNLGEAHMYGAGGQKRVPDDFVRNFTVAFPPPEEQSTNAAFLDHETAKIDALVQEQRRLIELLKEKRQAVISHAVTKGLNPNAPMKNSGIEWLGQVPAHWDVGSLKYFTRQKAGAIKTGPFGSQLTSAEMQSGEIKVYNQRTVIDDDFSAGDTFISQEKFRQLQSFETFPGDLLVTTRGTIGKTAIVPQNAEQGILHPCLLRIQTDSAKLDTQFLKSLIEESTLVKTQLSYKSNATTIEVIYSETMASVIVPVPPVKEQESILEFIHVVATKLDELIAEADRAIDLLQERRTALISAAVTGKIDVRGLVKEDAA